MIKRILVRRPRLPQRHSPGAVVVETRGVGHRFGERQVLSGVNLQVRAGELLALVGPNGSGKTTLLSVLAGDIAPDEGTVELDGRPIAGWSPVELAVRRAVLPQEITLAFPFSVAQVVRMGRSPWAGTAAEALDDGIVAASMDQTGVAGLAGRPFPTLSGGEKARVGLARLLAQRAPIVLLDEPTAALDIHHQEAVLHIARQRAEAGDAIVVVLHDLGLAAAHAHNVVVLSEGRVAAYGPPVAVLTEGLLSEVYRHDVEVLAHPRTGAPLVLPRRP